MKRFIVLLLLFISLPVLAQNGMGKSFDGIMAEFAGTGYAYEKTYSSTDSTVGLYVHMPEKLVFFNFDTDTVCNVIYIIPYNRKDVKKRIAEYNETYTIISKKHWQTTGSKGLYNIYLVDGNKNRGKSFAWSVTSDSTKNVK